jgi:putative ABC transport system permease protein
MLGIIIGVAAVIIIMSIGAGAQSLILGQVKSLGSNIVGILPGKAEEDGPPASVMGVVITTLTYEDLQALGDRKNVPNIVAVAGYVRGIGTVSWGAENYDTSLSGTSASYMDVEGGKVADGRFFNKDEEVNLSKVAVLGSLVKEKLFGDSDAIGQRIKYKNHSFEVIGVMAERGNVAFQNYDDQIFIPLRTMQKSIEGINHLGFIRGKVDEEVNIEKAINDISITLRERHDIVDQSGASDDFSARSAAQALDMIKTITDALRFFLAAMAALSLVVGGIGIMNIMLVSVTERTREIGLRKAIGATNKDILSQFLIEAVTITGIGGIFGIISGAFISFIASVIIKSLGYDWEFSVSLVSIMIAFFVSMMVGLIFGIYPASKASELQPVEALRYE